MGRRVSEAEAGRIAVLRGRGMAVPEIHKVTGWSERTIFRVLAEPTHRELAAAVQDSVAEPTAVETLRSLLSSQDEAIRLRAALGLLQQKVPEPTPSVASGVTAAGLALLEADE